MECHKLSMLDLLCFVEVAGGDFEISRDFQKKDT